MLLKSFQYFWRTLYSRVGSRLKSKQHVLTKVVPLCIKMNISFVKIISLFLLYTLWNKDTYGLRFYKVNLWVFQIAYHRWTYSYALDLSCPNRKRSEVYKNVKYIAITSRASKLQVFKVWNGARFEPGPPAWVT